MRLMITLFLYVIYINSAWAYPPHALDMTEYEYRRYVRPQLKSIIQDTHTLLILLNPELKPMKGAMSTAQTIVKSQVELKDNCQLNESETCLHQIESLKDLIKKFDNDTVSAIDLREKEFLNIDEKLSATQKFNTFRTQLLRAQVSIENTQLLAVIKKPKSLYLKILKHEINLMIDTFYDYITETSDNRFKSEFNNYWNTFVIPVYKYILVLDKKEYFLKNINDLNLRWNALNVRLSKRNKKISKQIKTLISIMHNRWNNILKVSLNPQMY